MKVACTQKELCALLRSRIRGEVHGDSSYRKIYATDASVYEQQPLVICHPTDENDLKAILDVSRTYGIPVTPRTAGTSLAGQAIGEGIIVDMSKHFTRILHIDSQRARVRVQPGVIRDELNQELKKFGLFFGPNTSTSNRCMMGGMVANNSSGTTSIRYGVTRDHIRRIRGILADGSTVEFGPLDDSQFQSKCGLDTLEGALYRHIHILLSNPANHSIIQSSYPKAGISRRNTGYALDCLSQMRPFNPQGEAFNFSKLIAGSEGTLMLITEIELDLSPIPPEEVALICPHFETLESAMEAVPLLLQHLPFALEMMDRKILRCTEGHPRYKTLRDWVIDDPYAVLMLELRADTKGELHTLINAVVEQLRSASISRHQPVLMGEAEVERAWSLRKAGLGLLGNMPGDAKAVACIEDTAVHPDDLKDYIRELRDILNAFGQDPVYYAHAGAGELHIRPVLNLKDPSDVEAFHAISKRTAHLVKKYRGSLSGEHGDGRVRGEFIPIALGEEVYAMLKELKITWDPEHLLNRGKITNTPPMDQSLRTHPGASTPTYDTILSFEQEGGIIRAAEKCNGSGDCRRTAKSQALMCPSYMASLEEYNTTRARANLLRVILREGGSAALSNPELKGILDLCLSCKGCLTECPSSVDITAMKAEVTHHYYLRHHRPLKDRLLGHAQRTFALSALLPQLVNYTTGDHIIGRGIKRLLGIHPGRSIPPIHPNPIKIPRFSPSPPLEKKRVWLLADEFTRYHEPTIIRKAIRLLERMGFSAHIAPVEDSARSQLSKGYLEAARRIARSNINTLAHIITPQTPLVGMEPSAILGFRDEYPKLLRGEEQERAQAIGRHCYTFDEWMLNQLRAGELRMDTSGTPKQHILVHTHCHQKALGMEPNITEQVLLHFPHIHVEHIPSGCCGMAGSFGYDKSKYELSMSIGELVLFPTVRAAPENALVCANGTSCRHQIKDGTERKALHLAEILYEMLSDEGRTAQ